MISIMKKNLLISLSLFSLLGLIMMCYGCAVPVQQGKSPEHFSHDQLSDFDGRTLVPFSGETLDEYIRHNFSDPNLQQKRTLFQNAWNYYNQKEWGQAIDWFQKALEDYPYLKDYATFFIAACFENKGEYKESAELLRKIIETWPESALMPRVYLKMADIHFCETDYIKAIEAYEKALKLFPEESAYIRYQIGLANVEMGTWEPAIESFKSLLMNEPDSEFSNAAQQQIKKIQKEKGLAPSILSSEEIFHQANTLFIRRYYQSAIQTYLSIINTDLELPDRCQALTNLAKSYNRIGKRDLAMKTFKEMIQNIPESECVYTARLLLARLLWNEHQNKEAMAHLEFLKKNYPAWNRQTNVLYLLGRMAEEKEKFIDAVDYYKQIIDVGHNSPEYQMAVWRVGWVYYMGGYFRNAVEHFDRYISKAYDKAFRQRLLYWKARAEEKRGNFQSALEIYQAILQEPYWSFYSGLSEIWLGCHDLNEKTYCSYPEGLIDQEGEVFFLLEEKEKAIVYRILELWMLDLKGESIKEIQHHVYSKKRCSPELLFCLSSIAHMNGAHELGIKIGILRKRSQETKEVSFYTTDELLIYPLGYLPLVQEKARYYDIDPILVLSVIRQESLFDPVALSRSSAYGLMQIIPSTGNAIAKELGIDISSDMSRLFDPDINLTFGCFFLKGLLDRFEQNMVYALASYNAGPNAVTRWQKRFGHLEIDEFIENIPYGETRDYVKRIMKNYWIYKRIYTPMNLLNQKQAKEMSREEDPHR